MNARYMQSQQLILRCEARAQFGIDADVDLSGFEDAGEAGVTAMRCLRQADALRQRHELMSYFGETCAEDVDLPAFDDPAYRKASAFMLSLAV